MKVLTPTVIRVLRWVGTLPVFVLGLVIGAWLVGFTCSWVGSGNGIQELMASKDFAGHYLIGPPFVLCQSSASALLGIMAATLMAPSYRHTVRIVFSIVTGVVVVVTTTLMWVAAHGAGTYRPGTEVMVRDGVMMLGTVVGIFASFLIDPNVIDESSTYHHNTRDYKDLDALLDRVKQEQEK